MAPILPLPLPRIISTSIHESTNSSSTGGEGSLTPASGADVLPAVLMPIFLVATYFLPPFRLRPFFFLVVLGLLEWGSFVSPWPPNEGDARPLRYGITTSWIFALPVLERVCLHVPERDFWRLDPGEDWSRAKGGRPREWSWEKVWWAVRLVCTPRGVGWDLSGGKMKMTRVNGGRGIDGLGRAKYVFGCAFRAFLCYLVWDGVMLAEQKMEVPEGWAWDASTLGRIAAAEVMMVLITYCGMVMQFEGAAAIGVALYLNGPEDWPPLFGSLVDCYTVVNVWGTFWHQYIRQPCLGISHALLRLVRLPSDRRYRPVAYFVHLLNAFVISDGFHILAVGSMASGYVPVSSVVADLSTFFLLQPLAGTVESIAMGLFARQKAFINGLILALCRLAGYVWVFCWFYVTGWWFVKAYLDVRMQDWQLPNSILKKWLFPDV
ncbi:membrane bound O-acyl transferase family-domain-containing protein [Echria macrotheca]|uniref:Membrane bound O-acyl transferase family-domain-containing protein n=1 Tax=Echria macrotheca TaxID=438768 RepID=A0AAJ0BDQ0_9PEZI|nr:membrane bound O-acyl transferase family-domain-containing protein [Echria macrotheca]